MVAYPVNSHTMYRVSVDSGLEQSFQQGNNSQESDRNARVEDKRVNETE